MVGLLGKAPCQPDFLRVNASYPLAQGFHRWLEEAHEALLGAKAHLPAGPNSFLFGAPGEKDVLVGVLQPSVDKVGRVFPLAVFRPCEASLAARELSALPFACERFMGEAKELLAASASLTLVELATRLAPLDVPPDFSQGQRQRQQALGARASELAQLVGSQGAAGVQYYALRTFVTACEADRAAMPASARVTLDCPVGPTLPPAFWLEVAQRLLRWGAPPALLWSPSRLLLSLGPSPASALVYLANPEHPSSRFWPLRTQKAAAIDSAKAALLPAQLRALDEPDGSLAQLTLTLAP